MKTDKKVPPLLWISVMCFLLILSSCNTPVPQVAESAIPRVTLAIAPSVTPTATLHPTDTHLPTVGLPTPFPGSWVETRCVQSFSGLSTDRSSSGNLVLESRELASDDIFLLNMATGELEPINQPGERQLYHRVSLDHQYLAYIRLSLDSDRNITQQDLVVTDAAGEKVITIPAEEGWTILSWATEDRLVIELLGTTEGFESTSFKGSTFLVLNPLTGERQMLNPTLPGLTFSMRVPYWDGWRGTVYDPTLTHVVYPYLVGKDLEFTFAIWNIEKQQVVATLENVYPTGFNDYFPVPRWAPDGSKLLIEGINIETKTKELYLLDTLGQTEQITNLNGFEELIEFKIYNWSPDGSRIGLWYERWPAAPDEEGLDLLLLDPHDHQGFNPCVKIENSGLFQAPLWSPDGKHLVVLEGLGSEHLRVFLVDPEKDFMSLIAEDMLPLGWLSEP